MSEVLTMYVKEKVVALVKKMPEDVTFDEVISWVETMKMLGVGVEHQRETFEELFQSLQEDFDDYFSGNGRRKIGTSSRKRRPSKKSAGAA